MYSSWQPGEARGLLCLKYYIGEGGTGKTALPSICLGIRPRGVHIMHVAMTSPPRSPLTILGVRLVAVCGACKGPLLRSQTNAACCPQIVKGSQFKESSGDKLWVWSWLAWCAKRMQSHRSTNNKHCHTCINNVHGIPWCG